MTYRFAHYCNRAAPSHVRHCNPMALSNAALERAHPIPDPVATPVLPQQKPAEDLPPSISVDVSLVNILASVHDKHGGLIGNLNKDDFTVVEDGKQQTIKYFTRETDLPLTIGLLIDVSASQRNLLDIEKRAAHQFFTQVLRKKDEAFLISFGEDSELLQDYTNSPKLLQSGLSQLQINSGASGFGPGPVPTISQPRGTVLYDAVYLAAHEKLRAEVGRKVIVLITDGIDQGSKLKIEEAIEAAQKSDVVIYSIDYADPSAYGMFSFGGSAISAPAENVRGDRRARVQGGPQAHSRRRLQGTAGRNAQPVFHRLHLVQSGAGRLFPQAGHQSGG